MGAVEGGLEIGFNFDTDGTDGGGGGGGSKRLGRDAGEERFDAAELGRDIVDRLVRVAGGITAGIRFDSGDIVTGDGLRLSPRGSKGSKEGFGFDSR